MIFLFVVTFVLILNIVFVNLFFCVCRWKCFSLFLFFFIKNTLRLCSKIELWLSIAEHRLYLHTPCVNIVQNGRYLWFEEKKHIPCVWLVRIRMTGCWLVEHTLHMTFCTKQINTKKKMKYTPTQLWCNGSACVKLLSAVPFDKTVNEFQSLNWSKCG